MSTASNKVLVLFGPTAVGKTATIERLASDDRLHGMPVVVVSCDSQQVYKGLDIGTAKPGAAERARIPHRLIDIAYPDESFSVGRFVELADKACADALAAGALPILSGGTAYYIRAFLYGPPPAPPADPVVRAMLRAELATRGADALRRELAEVDPASAARISPADLYRTTRALEVYRCSGKPLSSFAPPTLPRARWNTLTLGLDRPRAELYARVEARVDAMMAAGLEAEVAALRAAGYGPESPGMKAIGYAEFCNGGELTTIVDAIKLHTRRYAKRQLTFMRSLPGVRWFNADDYVGVVDTITGWLLETA
ncbi:MAG: tRNA (adenosine(37)-N6)-dimethylallyltransferase MiaA [Spirochaetales bacterium]|nr:tRNA (adenosine(37)-N6)-dimethylallyltransferase MiaA [Spirochaetales bacterium]